MNDWLENLKVGDRVAVSRGYTGAVAGIITVTRITKTRIVCGNETFRKQDGYAPGRGYGRSRISVLTEAAMNMVEDRTLRRRIGDAIKDEATSLETLRAMFAALMLATKATPMPDTIATLKRGRRRLLLLAALLALSGCATFRNDCYTYVYPSANPLLDGYARECMGGRGG
jgi:hypothetical protein